ncbi:CLUMA_CG001703, isoform A [Clunio marinus]|uniref:CLUMA_CG001703, isoform A n=1 Tax=Clunio marinus TaxID=568069 RepID=A0A1J1HKH8_9DIPT|nr:CLUMA_CG001703, isoform A [Clunio marinus]
MTTEITEENSPQATKSLVQMIEFTKALTQRPSHLVNDSDDDNSMSSCECSCHPKDKKLFFMEDIQNNLDLLNYNLKEKVKDSNQKDDKQDGLPSEQSERPCKCFATNEPENEILQNFKSCEECNDNCVYKCQKSKACTETNLNEDEAIDSGLSPTDSECQTICQIHCLKSHENMQSEDEPTDKKRFSLLSNLFRNRSKSCDTNKNEKENLKGNKRESISSLFRKSFIRK